MAKILFINPAVRQEQNPEHVPYGIALLAALAIQEGHLVQVYDANAWRLGDDVLKQAIEADDWDVIAAGGITTTYGYMKKICQYSKELKPNTLLVMGGGILTAMPRDIMTLIPQIDIGVVGEAFLTFNEILAQVDAKNLELQKINGLIYRTKEGGLEMTPPRALIKDLDALPYPAWELFPLEEVYFKNSMALYSEEGMTARRRLDINVSYGCSLVCKFCFHLGISGDMKYIKNDKGETDVVFDEPGSYARTIRYHSPKYVVEMVKYMKEKFNVDYIGFLDENLMTMDVYSKRTWMKEICRLWVEAGFQPQCVREGKEHDENCRGIHWSGTSHATLCTQEILKIMHDAGCSHLIYGYESFSPQILKRLGKGATVEANVRSFFWTMEAGIRPIPNQIIGFPSEDFSSIYDDMKAWEKLGIVVKPHFATPYPGSMWYLMYKDEILKQYDGDLDEFLLDLGDASKISAVISENFNALELLGLRELMLNFDYKKIREYEREWKQHHPNQNAIQIADDREKEYRLAESSKLSKKYAPVSLEL